MNTLTVFRWLRFCCRKDPPFEDTDTGQRIINGGRHGAVLLRARWAEGNGVVRTNVVVHEDGQLEASIYQVCSPPRNCIGLEVDLRSLRELNAQEGVAYPVRHSGERPIG